MAEYLMSLLEAKCFHINWIITRKVSLKSDVWIHSSMPFPLSRKNEISAIKYHCYLTETKLFHIHLWNIFSLCNKFLQICMAIILDGRLVRSNLQHICTDRFITLWTRQGAPICQRTFSNVLSWIKIVFWFKFHWSVFIVRKMPLQFDIIHIVISITRYIQAKCFRGKSSIHPFLFEKWHLTLCFMVMVIFGIVVTYNYTTWYLYQIALLTHWRRVTHICASNLAITYSDNGLLPGQRQAFIWTYDGIFLNLRKSISKYRLKNDDHFVIVSRCDCYAVISTNDGLV